MIDPEPRRLVVLKEADTMDMYDRLKLEKRATTEPDAARELLKIILDPADAFPEALFQALLNSVVIDLLVQRVNSDDEYAVVIGKRMRELSRAARRAQPASDVRSV